MTFYKVIYYCNDDNVTGYESHKLARNGSPVGAASRVFEHLPDMPRDIVGVVINIEYLH